MAPAMVIVDRALVAPNPKKLADADFMRTASCLLRGDLTFKSLLRVVSIVSGIPTAVILGPRGRPEVCKARQILFWLCRHYTELSYTQIGRLAGGRHHTSVMHGFGKVQVVRSRKRINARANAVAWAWAFWLAMWPVVSQDEARRAWQR